MVRAPVLVVLFVALLASPAAAHPLGNFTINHLAKIAVHRNDVDVTYVLDIAEIPSFQIMRTRSVNGRFDDVQLAAWARNMTPRVLAGFSLSVDGRPIALRADAPQARMRPGAGGLPLLYWKAHLRGVAPASRGRRRLCAVDRVYRGRLGWRDIIVAPQTEPTHDLLRYPSSLLGSPRRVSLLVAMLLPDGSAASVMDSDDAATASSSSQARSNTLSDMLSRGTQSPLFVILTLLAAIGLGALHALEPGHGKTLLAVSLVGSRATAKQALILAGGLTFAHTFGVVLLGSAMLLAAQWIVPEAVYPWVSVVSGIAVACLGARALAHALHHPFHGDRDQRDHARHPLHHHAIPGDRPLSFRGVLLAAMSGNLAPCPAALVVLLTALTLHRVAYGLVVILAFSLGLAGLLTALGIGCVRGAAWFSTRPGLERLVARGPLLSACAISLIGAAMIGRGVSGGSAIQTPALAVPILVLGAIAGYAFSAGHTHADSNVHDHERANV